MGSFRTHMLRLRQVLIMRQSLAKIVYIFILPNPSEIWIFHMSSYADMIGRCMDFPVGLHPGLSDNAL
jgi:hypothetical protein